MQYINHKLHRGIKSQNTILLLWCEITRMCLTSLQLFGTFLDELNKTRVFGYLLTYRLLFRTTEIKTSTTIILPAVLYGSKSRSLTMGKEYRPRMFETRVLRNLPGTKTGRVTGEWRQVHYEKFSRSVLLVKYYWED